MGKGMVSCSGCQAEYDASGYDPGDRFQCPECNTIVTIPGGATASAAPKVAARSGGTSRTSRGTSRASRPAAPRSTSKMRVVNEAVGMGALDPTVDPRAIRRAGQAPAPVSEGTDKMMLYGGVGVVAIAIIGLVIYIAKQPSAEEKKKAKQDKIAAQQAKEEADKKPTATDKGSGSSDPAKPRINDVPGSNAEITAKVSEVLTLVKKMPVDSTFYKVASQLLKYGPPVIGELVEHFNDSEQEVALAARAIVQRATKWSIPEEPFYSAAERERIKGDVFATWLDKSRAGTLTLVSEADFLGSGGATAENPPNPNGNPSNPNPGNPVGNPPKPTGGGTSEAAMRRDLPQLLSNYARGTFEDRDKAESDIRKFGKPVIGALIGALKEEDIAMANAANDLLQKFTKQDQGKVPGEPGDRPPFIEKWQNWWKGAEAGFSM